MNAGRYRAVMNCAAKLYVTHAIGDNSRHVRAKHPPSRREGSVVSAGKNRNRDSDCPDTRESRVKSGAGSDQEHPARLTEFFVGSAGQTLSFLLMADAKTARDLSGFGAWVTFWYEDEVPHVVRAARVDGPNGLVTYELRGDEFARKGVVFAQATVMSPQQGFFEHSSEIVPLQVLPYLNSDDSRPQPSASSSLSGLSPHSRIDLVQPERHQVEIDISTGKSKVVGPLPAVLGSYTFFGRSDPGQEWNDLFRTVATRLRLPWNAETLLAMITVFSQKAWEGMPLRQHQRYVAGSILQETRRSLVLEEVEERKHREREPLWEDLPLPHAHTRSIEEALPHDPQEQAEETHDWVARIENCRKVLSAIDDWSPKQSQLKGGLERQALAGEEVSPTEVGRALGWSHKATMSTWQSLQRKAKRAQRRHSGGDEEK